MTIQNLGSKTTILGFIPNDVVTATKLGSAIDLTNYEGDMVVLLDAEAGGASITYAVKLTASDTSGGTYTDVTSDVYPVLVDEVLLRGGAVTWRDDTTTPQTRLALKDVTLDASAIALPFQQPMQFNGSALLNGGGSQVIYLLDLTGNFTIAHILTSVYGKRSFNGRFNFF